MTQNDTNNPAPVESSRCPFCFGTIAPEARKCRHCGEWQNGETSTGSQNEQAVAKTEVTTAKTNNSQAVIDDFPPFPTYWGYIGAIVNFVFAIYAIASAPKEDTAIVFFVSFIPSIVLAYFLIAAPIKKYSAPYMIMSICSFVYSCVVTGAVSSRSNPEADLVFFTMGAWIAFVLSVYAYYKAAQYTKNSKIKKNAESKNKNNDNHLLPSAAEIARIRRKANPLQDRDIRLANSIIDRQINNVDDEIRILIEKIGINCENGQYVYGNYRYDKLYHAVAYAMKSNT